MNKAMIFFGVFICAALTMTTLGKANAFENSGIFLPYQVYPHCTVCIGSWPEAVAIGDVNGDTRNDVVMTTSRYFDPENDYSLFVFIQNPSGELELPPIRYDMINEFAFGNGESVDIGDLNDDGKADVVVTTANSIGVFLQDDSGGLYPMVTYPSNSYPDKVRIGDFNNDGLRDVVSIAWGSFSHDVEVFLQNEYGELDAPDIYTVFRGGFDDLEVGDVNNDGLQDIIVMSGNSYQYDNIGVLLQNVGGFDPPVYYDLEIDVNTHGVAVGDVNNDALEDIVVSYGGNTPSSHIATFLQNDSGTLDTAISYPSYDCPEPVEIADVNFDGRNDVLVLHGGWHAMGIYIQDNDGKLSEYELYTVPSADHYNPHGLAVGDINGDGSNDVAIADYNYGLVVLYHTGPVTNLPPVAYAGLNQSLVCTNLKGTPVILDGSGSWDPNGDPLTYSWSGPFPEGGGTVMGVNPTVTLQVGISPITLVVNDGEVDSEPDTVVITIKCTPQQHIELIIDEVETLVNDGALNQGRGNALIKKLEDAIQHLNKGKEQSAIKKLEDFINAVNTFIKQGVLLPPDGQLLIDEANDIITQLI